MIHDYSQMVPLTEAVSMTFSGKYPCAICKAIAERKQSENTKTLALEKYDKKALPPVATVTSVNPVVSSVNYLTYQNSLQLRTEAPPTPPPRQALS
jgi:hypothetical protein